MKRQLGVLATSIILILVITACGGSSGVEVTQLSDEDKIATEVAIQLKEALKQEEVVALDVATIEPLQTTPTEEESLEIEVDKGLMDVKITFPASMFEDVTDFDPDAYTKENNFKETVINEDGLITVTMSKSRHNELMAEMKSSVEEAFQELIEAENTPYIRKITSSDDYRAVTVNVDKEEYKNSFDLTPLMIYFPVAFYQLLDGAEYHCEVIIKDVETGEILYSIIYPDAFED